MMILILAGNTNSITFDSLIYHFIIIYIAAIIISSIVGSVITFDVFIRGMRTSLLFLITLFLSKALFTTLKRVEVFLKIFYISSLVSSIYGFRQLIFGLYQFEIDRLSLMGNVLGEIETLGRLRIPSTFGDPATFSFVMMLGFVFTLYYSRINWRLGWPIRFSHIIILFLILASLIMSLTRAPLVALFLSLLILGVLRFRFTVKTVHKILILSISFLSLIFLTDQIVFSESIKNYEGGGSFIYSWFFSIWSIIPDALKLNTTTAYDNLANFSANMRVNGLLEAIDYLVKNPFGGGAALMRIGGMGEISFSPVDVGLLRYGLEHGWLGLAAVVGLIFYILFVSYKNILSARTFKGRILSQYLFLAWMSVIIASSISAYLYTSVIAILVWTLAGIILNFKTIEKSIDN